VGQGRIALSLGSGGVEIQTKVKSDKALTWGVCMPPHITNRVGESIS